MTRQDGLSPSFVETVAGFTAGIVSTLCLHPVDLIKTRLQGTYGPNAAFHQDVTDSSDLVDRTASSRLGSSARVYREIAHNEGGIRAFYRGLTPNLIGNSTGWGIYFLFYGNLKDAIRNIRGSGQGELTSSDYFIASGTAGVITSVLTNPIWVIKTRMLSTGSRTPGAYASFVSGTLQIYRTEGLAGYYRGLLPSLFGVSHGAIQFMVYEQLKVYRYKSITSGPDSGSKSRELGNLDFFVTSSLSKIFAGVITYPYQVLRSRLQTYDAHLVYRGTADAIMQIWAKEGLAGFYKGLGPNLFRVLPSTWVTFLVYENTRAYLPKLAS